MSKVVNKPVLIRKTKMRRYSLPKHDIIFNEHLHNSCGLSFFFFLCDVFSACSIGARVLQ